MSLIFKIHSLLANLSDWLPHIFTLHITLAVKTVRIFQFNLIIANKL